MYKIPIQGAEHCTICTRGLQKGDLMYTSAQGKLGAKGCVHEGTRMKNERAL